MIASVHLCLFCYMPLPKARFFLLVDLQEFFFRFRVGGTGKKERKALKMTGHFQSFVFSFSELFFNISRTNSSNSLY